MYLKKSPRKDGRTYLSIAQNYRDGKTTKTKTIQSLGYVDELEKLFDDPIAHFTNEVKLLESKRQEELQNVILVIRPKETIAKQTASKVQLGQAVLLRYYHMLGINRFWDNRRMKNDTHFSIEAIFRLLSFGRILFPASKLASYERKDELIDRMDFNLSDIYQCLSYLNSYKSDLVSWVERRLKERWGHDLSSVYCAVTNFSFENDCEDYIAGGSINAGYRSGSVVQLGLLMDKNGIPLDFEAFSGNTQNALTMLPVLKGIKERYKGGRIILVADKELSTSDSITTAVTKGDGFILSQGIRGASKQLRDWVLDDGGHRMNGAGTYKIKSRYAIKEIVTQTKVVDSDGLTKTKKEQEFIPVKEIVFWSEDYAIRTKAKRAESIEKAIRLTDESEPTLGHISRSKTRYVKRVSRSTGNGGQKEISYKLDEKRITEDALYDGYYCLLTSETNLGDDEIINAYKGLGRIEGSFRITEADLESRPMHLSRKERVLVHFLICYVSLIILRLIQAELNWEYSVGKIAYDLSRLEGTALESNYYAFGYRTDLTDKLGELIGIDFTRRYLTRKELKDIIAKSKKS
jgi:hypothetical protein